MLCLLSFVGLDGWPDAFAWHRPLTIGRKQDKIDTDKIEMRIRTVGDRNFCSGE